jgi:S-adenosylmethionine decarboxylase
METKGYHVIADVWLNEYPEDNIAEVQLGIEEYLTIVGFKDHQFNEQAFTAVWLLSESHFSIHTYPERNFVSLDLYTCGERAASTLQIMGDIMGNFNVKEANVKVINRG